MADETQTPVDPTQPNPLVDPEGNPATETTPPSLDTAPEDDDSTEAPTSVCADGDDEDPEQHIGDALKDPWDDEFQTDWPQNEVTSA